ncbi:phosphoheptose isomerase [Chitinimonas taiwanensis]|jgi:D-sedoheptulose 7-phosphate isomerase|uniref:Phosphoheptose isomerase n=1 Tax=Chitinimonas taiwanensis DSM 18899 TaxID=1121279 RepID=A0A1K2HRT3_9NEIS|nr:phosphoheptose isomerase [Chitinimonas taiwanensis]SFZ79405.1 phosphoheptose isomerase [Chitinimonas taiwanensis DSM 18899]
MDLIARINQHFLDSMQAQEAARELLAAPTAVAAERVVAALMGDHKMLACGNGASAADAQHFAARMVSRFEKERPGLPAIALTTDTSVLSAIADDYDFDLVFSKQVRAIGQPGDVLLAFSPLGNSANVIEAIYAAHERQMTVIALTGADGGKITELLSGDDIQLNVPATRAARIQEVHLLLIHSLCDAIDCILLDGE